MSSVKQSNELDLGNLKPLLDRIFSIPPLEDDPSDGAKQLKVVVALNGTVPGNQIHPLRRALSESSADSVIGYLDSELKESHAKIERLYKAQLRLAAKIEEQNKRLAHLPFILERALENPSLEACNRALLTENRSLQEQVQKLWRENNRPLANIFLKRVFGLG